MFISHRGTVQEATLSPAQYTPRDRTRPMDSINNLVLTIKQVYCFEPVNPDASGKVQNPDGSMHPANVWTPARLEQVGNEFLAVAKRHWDNQFCLRTPASYGAYNYSFNRNEYRANIICRYDAVKVATRQTNSINVQVVDVPAGSLFRSNNRLWKSQDTTMRLNGTGNQQIAVVHEVGHNLGSDHVNGAGNDLANYGGVGTHNSMNIMGGGMVFEGWNAYSWQHAMEQITRVPFAQWEGVLGPGLTPTWVRRLSFIDNVFYTYGEMSTYPMPY